ncbi:hypothetical protein FC83_GL002995 [Agrilactobacillus composti DSM 18527 = JCM 14202]|uniref:Uncharacterized protein n=1 Tax=Agrilactobacillus composti DSM 18527 = JCM 14202 TaxID=1423734 RepID=X0PEF3_9LACO|nr:hypothetical protein [Agrilactobacillus composti]KRM36244.1 hypothetical protein FC83_GL002995 [Agrilactobacillus composti DSM 18527 = JCM 14202]GAF39984.1 hypothetical protein JCM14202_1867 [Agrilactobacillus composti DSM 18527 = JCM 14202]
MDKAQYLQALTDNLRVTPELQAKIVLDIGSEIDAVLEEGTSFATVMQDLGTPEKLAADFNRHYVTDEQIAYFEYKSNPASNFPLIHLVIPNRKRNKLLHPEKLPTAKGVIAIGRNAQGIIALGFFARGIISLGLLSIGLFSIGILSIGLVALGTIVVGGLLAGNIALGVLTLGNIGYGYAALGNIVAGQYTMGNIAAGSFKVTLSNNPTLAEIQNGLQTMMTQTKDGSLAHWFFTSLNHVTANPVVVSLLGTGFLLLIIVILLVTYLKNMRHLEPR